MSLQNRIRNILYQKADLMGYGGDGGYMKGTTRQNYEDARRFASQEYPAASLYEKKKLANRYLKEHVLGQQLKPYKPKIGFHPDMSSEGRKKSIAGLTMYKQIFEALLLSPDHSGETALRRRQIAKATVQDIKNGHYSLEDVFNTLEVSPQMIRDYKMLNPKQKRLYLKQIRGGYF